MRILKSLTLLAASALITLGITGSASAATQQELSAASVIEDIKKNGVLRVGMSTFMPWAMRDKKGDLIGFEIDVAKKVAKDMGVKIEFVPTQWSGIIPALIARKFDVIIGGMTITPQRNLTVNFSIPYAHSGQQMAASTKLASNLKNVEDYNSSSVTIACRRGSTACTAAKALWPKATRVQFDDDSQCFQEVINGNAHATLSSAPKPLIWTNKYPNALFMPTTDILSRGDEAFAMRKGDPDGMNFFSNWITVNTSNGFLTKTHAYWFKTMDWADKVDMQ